MNKALTFFLFFFLFSSKVLSQVLPAEGSKLYYRIIGFSVLAVPGGKGYSLEVAMGNFTGLASFTKNIIGTFKSSTNKVVAEVPGFGTDYTWRMVTGNKTDSALHHFSTKALPYTETNKVRLRILQQAGSYKDAFVFSDAARVLYDMDGNPVWMMPDIEGIVRDNTVIRDLKISCAGTILFMTMTMAYEIDYNGMVLWQAPNTGEGSNDNNEHYHHEFTRLRNGHYMVLGHELTKWRWQINAKGDSIVVPATEKPAPSNTERRAFDVPFGTLLEYDKKGKLLWTWKYSKFFMQEYAPNHILKRPNLDSHENAFFFDEKAKVVYISFKNVSQVLKVKYPEGKVIDVYGHSFMQDKKMDLTGLFCSQHACKKTAGGYLYLFNNNFCNPDSLPSVVMFREPAKKEDGLQKVWEYKYPIAPGDFKKVASTTGGNVEELPGGSMFASMCAPYGNVFIVGKDKHKQWDAILEKWDAKGDKWVPFDQYRASIISGRKLLEELIWNAR